MSCYHKILLFALAIAMSLGSAAKAEPSLTGRILWVVDGDTLKVVTSSWDLITVRVYGVDCPESSQPYGWWARLHTAGAALGREARLEPVERDRYGRLVARVIVKGESLGELLVRDGYAWVYDRYCNRPSCDKLRSLETQARRKEKGLWAEPDPIPPWRWRRGERPDSGWRFW